MLVCVKTLVEGKSFQEIRNSKEWLTTSETWAYILQHSLAASRNILAGWYGSKSWDEEIKEEQERLKTYDRAWFTPYREIYKNLEHVTVKDNAGSNVKFYNIGTILSFIEWNDARLKWYDNLDSVVEMPRGSFYDPEWFG